MQKVKAIIDLIVKSLVTWQLLHRKNHDALSLVHSSLHFNFLFEHRSGTHDLNIQKTIIIAKINN